MSWNESMTEYTFMEGMPNYDHDLSKVDLILDLLDEPGTCGSAGFMFKPARKFRGDKHPCCIIGKMIYSVVPDRVAEEFDAVVASNGGMMPSVDALIAGMPLIGDAGVSSLIHQKYGISGFMYTDLWGSNDGPNTAKGRKVAIRSLVHDWKDGKHLGEAS